MVRLDAFLELKLENERLREELKALQLDNDDYDPDFGMSSSPSSRRTIHASDPTDHHSPDANRPVPNSPTSVLPLPLLSFLICHLDALVIPLTFGVDLIRFVYALQAHRPPIDEYQA
jgi:hypothetical protein